MDGMCSSPTFNFMIVPLDVHFDGASLKLLGHSYWLLYIVLFHLSDLEVYGIEC